MLFDSFRCSELNRSLSRHLLNKVGHAPFGVLALPFSSLREHFTKLMNMSNRSPLWRTEQRSQTLELLTPHVKQRVASTSPGQHVFSRAWQLDEEQDTGGSAAASPGLSTHRLDLLSPVLPSQQRRQSWGPSVFSPSPNNTHSFQVLVTCPSCTHYA